MKSEKARAKKLFRAQRVKIVRRVQGRGGVKDGENTNSVNDIVASHVQWP